jgi:hypothetical protein
VLDIFLGGLANLIQQGQYTFWDYEHLYFVNALSGTALNAVKLLGSQINSTDALAAGIIYSTMDAARGNESSPVGTTLE